MAVQRRLPEWFKVRMPGGPNYLRLQDMLRSEQLHTVCEEAHCPNIGECWERGTATFMILGDICTRACAYCAVTTGAPVGLDLEEPVRLAETVERMGLRYAVITSVNRDDLPDGGAFIFRAVREADPQEAAGVQGGAADPGLRGQLGRARRGHGLGARYAQPQHRDGKAGVQQGTAPRGTTISRWSCFVVPARWMRAL